MEGWEYTVMTASSVDVKQLVHVMDELGKEGWELVAVLEFGIQQREMFFKRRLS